MNPQALGTWFVGVSVVVALSLSGCGSSGDGEQMMPGTAFLPVPMVPGNHGIAGGSEITLQPGASEEHGNVVVSCPSGGEACDLTVADDGTVNYQRTGGEPSIVYVLQPNGLIASTHTPEVFANSDADTLRNLLPTGTTVFAPLTAAIKRDYTQSEVAKLEEGETYLKSIAGDGMGGLHVTFVIEGSETLVHLEANDYSVNDGAFRKDLTDGIQLWLWSYSDAFAQSPRDRGASYTDYYDRIGWQLGFYGGEEAFDYRGMNAFGARTSPKNLPMGHAAYGGRVYAEIWNANDTSRGTSRTRLDARMVLEANFDDSEISGIIRALRLRVPGASQYEPMASGNSIDIENGRIAEGRFTAQWRGQDTNAGSAAEDSTRGFEGTLLGEFYGPAAEEISGVLNGGRSATTTTPEQVVHGIIWGEQISSTVPEGDLSVLSMATYRDFPASTIQHTDTAEVTAVESDDAGGYRVTYVVNGSEQTVHLAARDYGSSTFCSFCYHERIGNRSHWFWSASGSFSQLPEFDHFNVANWAATDWRDAGYTIPDAEERRGFVVYGTPTEILPGGTASYDGRVYAEIYQRDNPYRSGRSYARGRLALTANFGASTVGGMIDEIEVTATGQSSFAPSSGNVMIGNGVITGNELAADLTGTQDFAGFEGDMNGQFYGPAAAEAGGTFKGIDSTQNTVVLGTFGGTKQ